LLYLAKGYLKPFKTTLNQFRDRPARDIEFDWIGAPGSPGGYLGPLHDRKIAQGMARLVKEGYVDQILLSHDICTKIQYKKYGGFGYTYINDYFLPVLHEMGVKEEDIHKIMVENPARALTFMKPQKLK
jgi:phosphotriesterase-related protein